MAIQQALSNASWTIPTSLRVRIAIHTGDAEYRNGDYFGSFEIRHPWARQTFPPLRSLDSIRHNLPLQTVPIVGREREIADLRTMLLNPEIRLITLTGPGGIGKTRLGLQIAADLVDEFDDGVYFTNLAPVGHPEHVPGAIGQSLGIRETGGRSLEDVLCDVLRHNTTLLVIDNFEQVLSASGLLTTLLSAAPGLKILVTSRSVLHIRGEFVYTPSTLRVPDGSKTLTVAELAELGVSCKTLDMWRSIRDPLKLQQPPFSRPWSYSGISAISEGQSNASPAWRGF